MADNRGGEVVFTDGPFVESKEYLAGFWVIEAPDLDVALGVRRRGVQGVPPQGRGPALQRDRMTDAHDAITRAHREEWAWVVASLARRFGDLDVAEEAAAEAYAVAVERWPADGVPPNPGAWLTTTATRKAIDRIRREAKRGDKQRQAEMMMYDDPPASHGAVEDERLRLVLPASRPGITKMMSAGLPNVTSARCRWLCGAFTASSHQSSI